MCIRADPIFEYTEPQKVHWVLPSVRLATISTLNLVCINPKEKKYIILVVNQVIMLIIFGPSFCRNIKWHMYKA